jgi:hypothetical protein
VEHRFCGLARSPAADAQVVRRLLNEHRNQWSSGYGNDFQGQRSPYPINVFTVEPVKGFVSASLHRSLDGAKVVMCAQWRSVEDYQAMRSNPTASPYMQKALALARFELGMYEVVETFAPAAA